MKKYSLFVLLAFVACSPKSIELEWNTSWRIDVPYELSFNAEKLHSSDWIAVADGKELKTSLIEENDKEPILRFCVPEGTARMELRKGKPTKCSTPLLIDKAVLPSELQPFEIYGGKSGIPARFELSMENIASDAQGIKVSVIQYDKNGERIPEELTDGRWLTHLHPSHVRTEFRERAWIHPDAVRAELKVEAEIIDSVIISRLAVVPAAHYPFPGFDLRHFCPGVSGAPGDFGIRLGEASFWYQTRSWASWAGGYQMRDPKTFFFPVADGTVECWFKPDWTNAPEESVPLFEASHHASIAHSHSARFALGRQLYLSYFVPRKIASLTLRDADGREFTGTAAVDIPTGEWSHLAVTFNPGSEAVLFVDGKKALIMPLKGFRPVDIGTAEFPNDCHAMEFYLGASYVKARGFTENDRKWQNIRDYCDTEFHGEADLLRVSDCIRYTDDFTPAKEFSKDSSTKALFCFDETLDGANDGGVGLVTGIYKTPSDLYLHTLNTDKGSLQYYPVNIVSENDITKVLKNANYPEAPGEADFRASDRIHRKTMDIKTGESFNIRVDGPEVYMDYVEIENVGDKTIECPIVLRNGEIDFRSYADMAATLPDKSANTLFNYAISASDYFINHQIGFAPHSDIPFEAKDMPLSVLGSYCGFECGPLNKMLTQMYARSAGIPSNYLSGYGHEFQQIFFDGKNHVYDLSGQKFYSDMNNETAAGLGDMEDQPGIFDREGGSCAHFIKMGSRVYGATNRAVTPRFGYSLRPGEKFRMWWCNSGQANDLQILSRNKGVLKTDYSNIVHSTGKPVYRIDRFFPEYGNAVLEYDGKPSAANPAFCEIRPTSFCYLVESCYPVTAASYSATDACGREIPLEISTDSLRTFRPFASPASYAVRARTGYFIKVCAPISEVASFNARTVMHTNTRVQTGCLKPGGNTIIFKADNASSARLTFQYRTRGKDIVFKGAVPFGSLKGCEQSLVVLDPTKGPLSVGLHGLTSKAVVKAVHSESGTLDAILRDSELVLSVTDVSPRFAWVTVGDGNVEKTLTILICPGARLVQHYSSLHPGDSCVFDFEEIPSGRYAVMALDRFPGGIAAQRDRLINLVAGQYDIPSCSGVNEACNYYKAPFGPKGGRANWKWDFPYSDECSYPYDDMRILDLPSCSKLEYRYSESFPNSSTVQAADNSVELGAVLILPEPSRDFKCSILRNLCSVNTRPQIIYESYVMGHITD